MRTALFALTFLVASAGLAGAVELTLQRISSIAPIPVGQVTKEEMAPPPGVALAPARVQPSYEVFDTRQAGIVRLPAKAIPIPLFNPVSVSFCPFSDLGGQAIE
jgi:hypothetical protein